MGTVISWSWAKTRSCDVFQGWLAVVQLSCHHCVKNMDTLLLTWLQGTIQLDKYPPPLQIWVYLFPIWKNKQPTKYYMPEKRHNWINSNHPVNNYSQLVIFFLLTIYYVQSFSSKFHMLAYFCSYYYYIKELVCGTSSVNRNHPKGCSAISMRTKY